MLCNLTLLSQYEQELTVLRKQLEDTQNMLQETQTRLLQEEVQRKNVMHQWQSKLNESEERLLKQQQEKDRKMEEICTRSASFTVADGNNNSRGGDMIAHGCWNVSNKTCLVGDSVVNTSSSGCYGNGGSHGDIQFNLPVRHPNTKNVVVNRYSFNDQSTNRQTLTTVKSTTISTANSDRSIYVPSSGLSNNKLAVAAMHRPTFWGQESCAPLSLSSPRRDHYKSQQPVTYRPATDRVVETKANSYNSPSQIILHLGKKQKNVSILQKDKHFGSKDANCSARIAHQPPHNSSVQNGLSIPNNSNLGHDLKQNTDRNAFSIRELRRESCIEPRQNQTHLKSILVSPHTQRRKSLGDPIITKSVLKNSVKKNPSELFGSDDGKQSEQVTTPKPDPISKSPRRSLGSLSSDGGLQSPVLCDDSGDLYDSSAASVTRQSIEDMPRSVNTGSVSQDEVSRQETCDLMDMYCDVDAYFGTFPPRVKRPMEGFPEGYPLKGTVKKAISVFEPKEQGSTEIQSGSRRGFQSLPVRKKNSMNTGKTRNIRFKRLSLGKY